MADADSSVRQKHITFDASTSDKVEAVNVTWLSEILASAGLDANLKSIHIIDVVQGGSVKIRIGLEYEDEKAGRARQRTVIVKGGFDRHSGEFGQLVRGVHRSEMLSYRDVIEPIRSSTGFGSPRIYFAGYYPTEQHPILVMEDLTGRATFNNALTYIGYEDMRKLVDAVARYHALWWNSSDLEAPRYSWIESIYESSVKGVLHQICSPNLWENFLRLPRGVATPRPLRDPAKARAAIDNLAIIHEKSRQIFVHLDCHIGNTYFNEHGEASFVDWSLYRAPWHHEVAYLVVSGLDIGDRRQWDRALIDHYLERLKAYGAVDVPSFEEAWLRYRQELIYGMVLWIGNGDEDGSYQPEPINTATAQRFVWAAMDHNIYGLHDNKY